MLYRLNLYAGFVNNDLLWFIGYVLILVIVINIQCITINIISIPSSVTVTVRAGLTHTSHIPVPSLIFRRSRGHHMCQVIQCTEWNPPPSKQTYFQKSMSNLTGKLCEQTETKSCIWTCYYTVRFTARWAKHTLRGLLPLTLWPPHSTAALWHQTLHL